MIYSHLKTFKICFTESSARSLSRALSRLCFTESSARSYLLSDKSCACENPRSAAPCSARRTSHNTCAGEAPCMMCGSVRWLPLCARSWGGAVLSWRPGGFYLARCVSYRLYFFPWLCLAACSDQLLQCVWLFRSSYG